MAHVLKLEPSTLTRFVIRNRTESKSEFGRLIRSRRKAQRMSLADLAKKLGVTGPFVSSIERGRSSLVHSNHMVQKIADALDIDVATLTAVRSSARKARKAYASKRRIDPLGKFLTERRIGLNLNQSTLCECVGISAHHLSHIERFGVHDPDVVQKFATALDCQIPPDLIPRNGNNGHMMRFKETLAKWEAEATGEGQRHLGESIYDIELSVRAFNCLSRADILTVGAIRQLTSRELLSLRCFGVKTLREIEEFLGDHKLSLKPEMGTS
jgi:transcriptional regulator with XRE-family HTH domain